MVDACGRASHYHMACQIPEGRRARRDSSRLFGRSYQSVHVVLASSWASLLWYINQEGEPYKRRRTIGYSNGSGTIRGEKTGQPIQDSITGHSAALKNGRKSIDQFMLLLVLGSVAYQKTHDHDRDTFLYTVSEYLPSYPARCRSCM